jgi:hypothetical protein
MCLHLKRSGGNVLSICLHENDLDSNDCIHNDNVAIEPEISKPLITDLTTDTLLVYFNHFPILMYYFRNIRLNVILSISSGASKKKLYNSVYSHYRFVLDFLTLPLSYTYPARLSLYVYMYT